MNGGEWALSAEEVLAILPHRPPMLHVDRVLEVVPGERIVAVREARAGDVAFAGHFPPPGKPIFPGVLLVEAIAQAGALLVHRTEPFDPSRRPLVLLGIDRARFRRPVVPGDTVLIEVAVAARRGDTWRLKGQAKVRGLVAAEATILAAIGEPT
jgi:3-hydroxyacyl-[acyl-carrier-protein] dehydratase